MKAPRIITSQYDVPSTSEKTLEKVESVCGRFSKTADIILLPEYCAGTLKDIKAGLDAFTEVKKVAKKFRTHLAGAIIRKEKDKLYNVGFLISDMGESLLEHKKIYLAPPEYEQDGISHGVTLKVAPSKFGEVAMLICKDTFNKYSEDLFLALREKKPDIVLVPTWSLFWEERDTMDYIRNSLVRGCYLVNAYFFVSGNLNKETGSFGHAMIIDPKHGLIKEGSRNKEEYLTGKVDFNLLEKVRVFDERWQPKKRLKFKAEFCSVEGFSRWGKSETSKNKSYK